MQEALARGSSQATAARRRRQGSSSPPARTSAKAIEKDVAAHPDTPVQVPRDQLMASSRPTRNTTTMQHEIATPQGESRSTRTRPRAHGRSRDSPRDQGRRRGAEDAAGGDRRRAQDARGRRRRAAEVARRALGAQRAAIVRPSTSACSPPTSRSPQAAQGIAVAEASDGSCTVCHVRLRPQMFNEVRRSDNHHPVRELPADPLLRARRRRDPGVVITPAVGELRRARDWTRRGFCSA